MRTFVAAVLMLAVASVAGAQEAPLADLETASQQTVEAPAPAPAVVGVQSPAQDLADVEIRVPVEERQTSSDSAALPTQRGSFWWYVAILVVAGVILAVVL